MKKLFLLLFLLIPSLIETKTITRLVTIYHKIGRGGALESVKQHGLLSLKELFVRHLINDNPYKLGRSLLTDHYHNIYFDPLWRYGNNANNTVGLKVDPDTTYVYNREFRFDSNQDNYNRSKVLLATYLANIAKAKEMKKDAPQYHAVIFDPYTSEPFYVKTTDKRYYDPTNDGFMNFNKDLLEPRHYLYLAEVIIKSPEIKPKNLIFFDENYKAPENQKLN